MCSDKEWADGLIQHSEQDLDYIRAAEDLERHLKKLCFTDGSRPVDISIKITERNITTEYKLYDHAALVQGIMDAVGDFIDSI